MAAGARRTLGCTSDVWRPTSELGSALWSSCCGQLSPERGRGKYTPPHPTPPPTKKRLFHQPNISHHQQHSVLQTSRRLKTEAISHDSATTPINPNFNPPETKLRFHLFHLQRVFPQLCTTLFSFLRFSRFELSLTFSFLIISTKTFIYPLRPSLYIKKETWTLSETSAKIRI